GNCPVSASSPWTVSPSSSARSPTPTPTPLPVNGDIDYGKALNVMHMVSGFEDAGAGAVHLEEQLLSKKCGHLNDRTLARAADMATK
ncbi:hypothetical protein NO272_09645, partial [Campylobacter jejuni]|nr:hypothetical protein [Campylobacter jejuni]